MQETRTPATFPISCSYLAGYVLGANSQRQRADRGNDSVVRKVPSVVPYQLFNKVTPLVDLVIDAEPVEVEPCPVVREAEPRWGPTLFLFTLLISLAGLAAWTCWPYLVPR